jgi:regulator of protease activity HflC (stomatin/prohibitin superfamily)
LYGGEKGVKNAEILTGGRVWYNGYTEKIVVFPTFIKQYSFTQDPTEGSSTNEEVTFSVGGVSVSADIGVNYGFVAGEKLREYYARYQVDGDQFRAGLLRTELRNCFSESAELLNLVPAELPFSQQKLLGKVLTCTRTKFPSVNIEAVSLLKPMRLPKEIQEAINQQYQARQYAQTAVANKQKAVAEAAAAIATAKGAAQADLERSKGEAASLVAAAEGEAKANQIRQRSITPGILELKKLEIRRMEVEKWNGQKPGVTIQTPNVQVPNVQNQTSAPEAGQ